MRQTVTVLAAALLMAAAGGVSMADEAAPAEAPGKAIFLKNSCNSCHTIAAQGIAKKAAAAEGEATAAKEAAETKEAAPAKEAATTKGAATKEGAAAGAEKRKPPDLSAVGLEREAGWISKYLQKLEAIKEKKHMKKFKGTDEELTQLAAWLASQKDAEAAKKASEAVSKEKEGTKEEAAPATTEKAKDGETTK